MRIPLRYDKEKGRLITVSTGQPAEYLCKNTGYLLVYLGRGGGRVPKRAHRVIWEMEVGDIPEGYHLDHIDGDRANNKLSNLRLATNQENSRNRYVGDLTNITVRGSSHRVRLKIDGVTKYFGSYNNLELAQLVRDEVRAKFFGEFKGRWC